MNPLRTAACAAALAAALLVAGCGSATAYVRGVAPLNVNDANESTPVDIRLYQLASDAAFLRATFEALWVDAAKALGGELVGEPTVATVFPGSHGDQPTAVTIRKLDGKAKFVGVMALYRRTDGRDRRTLVVPVERLSKAVIEVTGYAVGLADPAAEAAPTRSATVEDEQPAENGRSGG